MYKLLLLLFCGVVFMFPTEQAHAYSVKPINRATKQVIHVDSTKLQIRAFNINALREYTSKKDFKYNDDAPAGISLWDRFWRWIWEILANIIGSIKASKSSWLVFKYVLFILATGVITFIIFKVLGIDIINILRGESKNVEIPYAESSENIHDINFDTEIETAIANRNYRLAVRLLYLRSLKQLSDAQLIHWQIEKTNSNYLDELTDTEQRQLFSLLTTQFEYVWYGDFQVDNRAFQNINILFIDFKKRLP